MKYTVQLYVSGGYQLPLSEPLPKGTPFQRVTATHINFLVPCPWTHNIWPESYIDGYWGYDNANDEGEF
jgi:hypothetical protein